MLNLHQMLVERFAELRAGRGEHPVYFIEHGLSVQRIDEMFAMVRSASASHPAASVWWRSKYFPLLIAAVEVGYRYRGTGTDFWPRLEERLSCEFATQDRERLSWLFERASTKHGGVRPQATRWARTFCHIAWPIAHAMLPLEFHRPFAQTLATIRPSRVGLKDGERLHRALVTAGCRLGGGRFAGVLADARLVVGLARHFLKIEDDSSLAPETLRRISADLHSDVLATRDVAVARRRRERSERGADEPTARSGRTRRAAAALTGTLYLRMVDTDSQAIELEATLPAAAGELAQRARRLLRRRRYAPRLWGSSAHVPGDQLLSGLPFRVVLPSLLGVSGPLLPDADELGVDAEITSYLQRLSLDLTPPLIFQERADEGLAAQLKGGVGTVGKVYWVLSHDEVAPRAGVTHLGRVAGMECHRASTDEEGGRELLARMGVALRFRTSADWVGDPAEDVEAVERRQRVGDAIVVSVGRVPPDGATATQDNGESQTLPAACLLSLSGARGSHSVEVVAEARPMRREYTVAPAPEPTPLSWVTLEGEEPNIASLLQGGLSLRVDAIAPIDGMDLTVAVSGGGLTRASVCALPPLPQSIGPDHPIWARVLTEDMRDALRRTGAAKVRALVGGLADGEWLLEAQLRSCWWERDGSRDVLLSDAGPLAFGHVPATAPAAAPVPDVGSQGDEGVLLVPRPEGLGDLEPEAEFAGLFKAPARLSLHLPRLRKPSLVRARASSRGGIGLEPLIAAMLRWCLSGSDGIVADLRRRQIAAELEAWTVELTCGSAWIREESRLVRVSESAWELLVRRCEAEAVGFDTYVELDREDTFMLGRLVVQQLQFAAPDLWIRPFGATRTGELYEQLDLAFLRAYELLARSHREAGRRERAERAADADPGNAPEEWDQVIDATRAQAELHRLADLLIPTAGGDELLPLDYTEMGPDDLVEEVVAWAKRHRRAMQGRLWEPEEVRGLLLLWLDPSAATRAAWRAGCERYTTDRWTSRAVRYAVLRRRSALAVRPVSSAAS